MNLDHSIFPGTLKMFPGALKSFRNWTACSSANPPDWRCASLHLLVARLPNEPAFLNRSFTLLSRDEQERATRASEPVRHQMVAARALLRTILGCYLDRLPQNLTFSYTVNGKPFLENRAPHVFFNLSHAQDLFILGLSKHGEIGVDIELASAEPDDLEAAEMIMSDQEFLRFSSLPPVAKRDRFYRSWCRREAYLKAYGKSIGDPVDDLSVSLFDENADRFEATNLGTDELLTFMALHVEAGVNAAVVVRQTSTVSTEVLPECWHWTL